MASHVITFLHEVHTDLIATLTPNALTVLHKRPYLRQGETPSQLFERVADAVSQGEPTNQEHWREVFYKLLASLRFLPNSPTLVNAGTGKGCLSGCFVLVPEDNMPSILQVGYDAGLIEKWGGGIGFGLSKLRPRGDLISTTHGQALGVLGTLRIYSTIGHEITQGAFRLGAHMGQLIVSHPQVQEFIHCKEDGVTAQNFNLSVQLTDRFMQAVENDEQWELVSPRDGSVWHTVAARDLWKEICDAVWRTGDPGAMFLDRVWDTAPNPQLDPIWAQNPCWQGDTLVWTIEGPQRFKDLVGREVPVLTQLSDGTMGFRVMRRVHQTRDKAKLLRVTIQTDQHPKRTKTQSTLVLTPDHNLYTYSGERVRAKDLKPGDRLASVYRSKANQKGYLRLRNESDSDMEHRIVASWTWGARPAYPEYHVDHLDENKGNNHPANLRVLRAADHNALNMTGAQNPVNRFPEKNPFNKGFSGDANGMFGRSHSEDTRRKIGEAKRAKVGVNHTVVSVEELETEEPVYNGVVDETHRYYVQCGEGEGVLSANCGEESLENYGSCNLGSINLAAHVRDGAVYWEGLVETVRAATRFLNDVTEINVFPPEVPRLRESNQTTRRIGLGVMGWADLLVELGIPYDSEEAVGLAARMSKMITDTAWEESGKLAEERGSFPEWENSAVRERVPYPVRNSSVTTIAPTGTISIIAGCSSGIEPHYALAAVRKALWKSDQSSQRFLDVVPRLERELIAKVGVVQAEQLLKTMAAQPETAHEMLRQHELDGELYRASHDVAPRWHVLHQAAWQQHVTNGVSKTINMPSTATPEDIGETYMLAWRRGCKGITVYRDSSKGEQVLNSGTCPDCDDVLAFEEGCAKCHTCGWAACGV